MPGVALPGPLGEDRCPSGKGQCADYSQPAGLLKALRPGLGRSQVLKTASLQRGAAGPPQASVPAPPLPRPLAGLLVGPAQRSVRLAQTHAREPAAAAAATTSAPAPGQRCRPRAWTLVAAAAAAVRLPAQVRKGNSGPRGSPWPQTAAPRTGRADRSANPARRPSQHPRPRYPRSRHMCTSFIPQPLPEPLPAPQSSRPPGHALIQPGQFSLSLIPPTASPQRSHCPNTCPTHCSYLTSSAGVSSDPPASITPPSRPCPRIFSVSPKPGEALVWVPAWQCAQRCVCDIDGRIPQVCVLGRADPRRHARNCLCPSPSVPSLPPWPAAHVSA